jgi:hypothetical protein
MGEIGEAEEMEESGVCRGRKSSTLVETQGMPCPSFARNETKKQPIIYLPFIIYLFVY